MQNFIILTEVELYELERLALVVEDAGEDHVQVVVIEELV